MAVAKEIGKHFECRDLGDIKDYLGLQVERDRDGAFLIHQTQKIDQLRRSMGLEFANTFWTPMEAGFLAGLKDDNSNPLPNGNDYRQAIGSLQYLVGASRPDIAIAVALLSRANCSPRERDWKAVKRVVRYLGATRDWKLFFPSNAPTILPCYVDVDWAGDPRSRLSTTGYVFLLGGSSVHWSSGKQEVVAQSSTEAEYVAVSTACKELVVLRRLLEEMGLPQREATVINEDNTGCISIIESERVGRNTRHIDTRHRWLHDICVQNIIQMVHCPAKVMVADVLTKPLGQELFKKFVQGLGLVPPIAS
jgi:hypothetical protein